MEINETQWKSIVENQWQLFEIIDNQNKSMNINGNRWTSIQHFENQYQFMKTIKHKWKPMKFNTAKSMKIHEDR